MSLSGLLKVVGTAALISKLSKVGKGARPEDPPGTQLKFFDKNGGDKLLNVDNRVKIRVPAAYTRGLLTGGPYRVLTTLTGIIFPYTPAISYEYKADYVAQTPSHTNFGLNFYNRSSVGSISIQGKFTVQNSKDAAAYLSTIHLLKALTRMKTGNDGNSAGSPPPVCRLDAYGDYMIKNVPVAITSFRIELPESIDYYTLGKDMPKDYPTQDSYGQTTVPTVSTISITCIPMYSRSEMQKFSVDKWLAYSGPRTDGYL